MRSVQNKSHTIDFLFVITLFFLFAISSLAMIAVGAKVYRNSVDHMSTNSENRTAYLYITEKIRQNDEKGAIQISYDMPYEGIDSDALILSKAVGSETYNTYLYLSGNHLMEIQVKAGNEKDVDFTCGQEILEASGLEIEFERENLLSFCIDQPDGSKEAFKISLYTY